MVFDSGGNPLRVTLSSGPHRSGWQAGSDPRAACSLPVPALKPGDLQKLQMGDSVNEVANSIRHPQKMTTASPGQPANHTGPLDCSDPYLCFLSYLSLEQPERHLGKGKGRGRGRGTVSGAHRGKAGSLPFSTTGFWASIWPHLGTGGAGQRAESQFLN